MPRIFGKTNYKINNKALLATCGLANKGFGLCEKFKVRSSFQYGSDKFRNTLSLTSQTTVRFVLLKQDMFKLIINFKNK